MCLAGAALLASAKEARAAKHSATNSRAATLQQGGWVGGELERQPSGSSGRRGLRSQDHWRQFRRGRLLTRLHLQAFGTGQQETATAGRAHRLGAIALRTLCVRFKQDPRPPPSD